jgi:hypothetical protein
MAIDANVAYVELNEDGGGTLHLCDRVPNGSRGQSRLSFDTAPYEVTALNGLPIWGGAGQIMLGSHEIAKREGYTRISFSERETFLAAVAAYHRRERLLTLSQGRATP